MIDQQLLEILRCPVDLSPLSILEPSLVAQTNREIAAGRIVNVVGHPIKKSVDGGLVRSAGDLFYPIVDQIPVMLPDEGIELSQLRESL